MEKKVTDEDGGFQIGSLRSARPTDF